MILLSVLSLCCQYADSLIGLRPPSKTPPKKKKDETQIKPTSPRSTQLHSPYNPSTPNNLTADHDTSSDTQCQPISLLRCSYRLLRQSLQNDSSICRHVQEFSRCSQSSLREIGRRDFVIGSDILGEFTRIIYSEHRCHGNTSSALSGHTRHQRSKRHGSHCCVDGIIECAAETFLKMATSHAERCPLIDFYDLCLHEATATCRLTSLNKLYPVFTLQLKRKCKTARIRYKREISDTRKTREIIDSLFDF